MKKFLIPALAVTVSVFSAFVTKPTTQLFRFNGASGSWQDRVDPAKYSTDVPVGCSGDENVFCSLIADADGSGKPIIGTSGALYNALSHVQGPAPDFNFGGIQGKP